MFLSLYGFYIKHAVSFAVPGGIMGTLNLRNIPDGEKPDMQDIATH